MATFRQTTPMPVGADALWRWHASPGAFSRLTPPWEPVEVEEEAALVNGQRARFRLTKGKVKLRWEAEIEEVIPGSEFRDRQIRGPFAEWEHTHRFLYEGDNRSVLDDEVRYRLPLGLLGSLGGSWVHRNLERMFRYRHEVLRQDLSRHFQEGPPSARVVLVTGATGFIGGALVPFLKTLGHTVRVLSRQPEGENAFAWDPAKGELDRAALEGVDAIIHLAGENIAGGLWTDARKKRILGSRVEGTQLLAEAAAKMEKPPDAFVSASGANVYALDGQPHDEAGEPGDGFLAEVCRAWESSARAAREAGIRTVFVRTGIVLSGGGGVLGKMLPAFQFGLGGPVGGGKQHMSWIAMDDLLDIYAFALSSPDWKGPVNAVSPNSVQQKVFARTLGSVLSRPAIAPIPAFVVKGALGQMGRETLLADLCVVPGALRHLGFTFRYPDLRGALEHVLGRR